MAGVIMAGVMAATDIAAATGYMASQQDEAAMLAAHMDTVAVRADTVAVRAVMPAAREAGRVVM
jgi:hypothetical protein